MDLRALMQKLETIDKKQIVTESVETKKVITESVAPVRQSTVPVFKSSIARGIVEQFGYEVEESTLTENPHASDPAKSAAWAALSPEDQKWLGGADPTDKFILARAPNKGKPAAAPTTSAATGVGNPGEEAAAQAAADKMATTSAATGVGNPGEEAAAQAAADKADAAAGATDMSMGQAGAVNAAQTAALASGAQDDVTGVDKAVAANAAAPTGGAAASPAKPAAAKPAFKADPVGQSIANQLKMTTPDAIKLFQKNNGLQADGQIGPATTKALQAAAQKMGLTVASGVGGTAASPAKPAPYNAAKDSQAANVAPAGGTAASPAAPVDPTKLSVSQRIATQPSIIDQGRAKLGIPAGGTSPAKESVVRQDDAVLAMIRNIRV